MIVRKLSNFYKGSTFSFDVVIAIDGIHQDITGDSVELILSYGDTAINFTADVSGGVNGIAAFTLTATETDITSGLYNYEIRWTSGSNVQKIKDTVQVLA